MRSVEGTGSSEWSGEVKCCWAEFRCQHWWQVCDACKMTLSFPLSSYTLAPWWNTALPAKHCCCFIVLSQRIMFRTCQRLNPTLEMLPMPEILLLISLTASCHVRTQISLVNNALLDPREEQAWIMWAWSHRQKHNCSSLTESREPPRDNFTIDELK